MDTRSTTDPMPTEGLVVTDAGLETWLIFDKGVDLPAFAAFPLVASAEGRHLLTEYYDHYLAIAASTGASVLLETPTWRANPDWAASIGHDVEDLAALLDESVRFVRDLGARWSGSGVFLVSGTVGPRGDGYRVDSVMDADEAAGYHGFQIERMAATGVDLVTAMTLGYVEEAVGVARAARSCGVPVVLSFTVETDGRLPSGTSLGEAIRATDDATDGYATHYMVNCAHPTHFDDVLDGAWRARLGGVRANASTLSHAELDEMTELDAGDPADLARRYLALQQALPALRVVGGCCGTDHRHVAAIAEAWTASTPT